MGAEEREENKIEPQNTAGASEGFISKVKPKTMEIYATITRADGTIENLGMIGYQSSNWFKNWLFRAKKCMVNWYNTGF